jgi:formamidopyrimidine-DNA glycosylase
MPELPDLQVFSRNLTKLIAGKKLSKVILHNDKKVKRSEKEFKKTLEGQKLKKIYREGKEIHLQFESGDVLGLHMMLRGQLHYFEGESTKKFPIIELKFSDDSGLIMTDFQGQATPTLNPEVKESPDALSPGVNYKFLKEKLGKTRSAVKNVLLDQHAIRGIGNAYADEILYQAGISPFSASNKIPDAHIKKLDKAIKKVLLQAEQHILKTHPDIISGEVRDFLDIHNSRKTHSPSGGEIIVETKGGRKTYYTEEQELFS